MSDIIFERVTPEYARQNETKKIYEEAFPESERALTFEDLVKVSANSESASVLAAVKDDNVIGMITVIDRPEYAYLLYLAVKSEYRCAGLGSKIMTSLMERFSTKPLLFGIELPVEGNDNYEQRLRRQAFYERLGCMKTNVILHQSDEIYLIYSSRKCDRVKQYMEYYLQFSEKATNSIFPSEEDSDNADVKLTLEEV